MERFRITKNQIELFKQHLIEEERSRLTVDKYLRDIRAFQMFSGDGEITKQDVIEYKRSLTTRYKDASTNSMVAALNSFFSFCGWVELKVKAIKIQRAIYAEPEKELSREEYSRLLHAAVQHKNNRLNLVMQTICSTGIRVSELQYITVEAINVGRAMVLGKGKRRTVFLSPKLQSRLLKYVKQQKLTSGAVFLSRNGNPLNRHAIWADMKALCAEAGVAPQKVFPHNLRHLFARTFYALEKDLLRLADILGHSSINTTRVYTVECGSEHIKLLQKMPLLM